MATLQQPQTTVFHVLGRQIDCSGCSADLIRQLQDDWLFTHHQVPDTESRITIRQVEAPGPLKGGVPIWVHAMQQDLPLSVAGQEAAFSPEGQLLLRASYSEGISEIEVQRDLPGTRSNLAALKVMVAEALRLSGLLPLHAAVAVRGKEACAFIGPSGTGKSTTLLRAVAAGWTALAEDFVWIDPVLSRVYGWDRGLRLLPDSLAALPEALAGQPWQTHPDGKYWIPFEVLHPLGAFDLQAAHLARVAILERRSDQSSAWTAHPGRLAVQGLWMAAGLALTAAGSQATGQQLSQLLAQVEVGRLILGSGPLPL